MSKSLIMTMAAKKHRLKKEGVDPEYDKFLEEWNAMSDEQYKKILKQQLEESENFGKLK